MKDLKTWPIAFSAFIALLSLAVLNANALNIKNIIGSTIMALGVGVIAWIAKRKSIALGLVLGALVFAGLFTYIDQMGWLSKE